jgi:teichuronic acid biosynthesis glycosyltransferase TuaG
MKDISTKLVSIIMPNFNSANYLEESINSVLRQSHKNWELIVVDDNSTDSSVGLLKSYSIDKRIKVIFLDTNHGPAYAREVAINHSSGDYIAFLDSDDIWHEDKLDRQVSFMVANNHLFTYTNYIPFSLKKNYRKVKFSKVKGYRSILFHSPGNSTVMIEADLCRSIKIQNIKKRNDYLYFLTVIKRTKFAYLLDEDFTFYRLNPNGISNKKSSLISYHWLIYRKIEKLNFFYSLFILIFIIFRKFISTFLQIFS